MLGLTIKNLLGAGNVFQPSYIFCTAWNIPYNTLVNTSFRQALYKLLKYKITLKAKSEQIEIQKTKLSLASLPYHNLQPQRGRVVFFGLFPFTFLGGPLDFLGIFTDFFTSWLSTHPLGM